MTDETRGPCGLFRPGHSGHAETMFKPGDPGNPRTQAKRARRETGEPSAKRELKREEMRAELVALDVLERLLSKSRAATAPRLPRLPGDLKSARREADRLAARSLTRSLRAMQRIARDPHEPPEIRAEVARLLLERGVARLADGIARGAQDGADGKEKKPKVILVETGVPRSPWQLAEYASLGGTGPAKPDAPVPPSAVPNAPPAEPPSPPRKAPWQIVQERTIEALRQSQEMPAPPFTRPRRPPQKVAISEE